MRRLLVDFEKPRTFGTIFETQNLGKSSIALDLKTKDDVQFLKELLKDADILITNTRRNSLVKLGLTFEDLHREFPHLIYAHVSAWGVRGKDAGLPGYDIGAFWAGTGLAAMVNTPERFSTYPGAFGDMTTSQLILSSIQMSLLERMRGGVGRKIELSLIHVGTWMLAPHVLTGERFLDGEVPDYSSKPAQHLVDQVYGTKSDTVIGILYKGSFADEAAAEAELRGALGLDSQAGHLDITKQVAGMTVEEVDAALESCSRLRTQHYTNLIEMWDQLQKETSDPSYKPCKGLVEPTPPGYDDVPLIPRIPYEYSGYPQHGSLSCAPHIGEHSECIRKNKWLNEAFGLPKPDKDITNKAPSGLQSTDLLRDIVVLEVSDTKTRHDVAIAATGKLLAEAGAKVHRILLGSSKEDSLRAKTVESVYDHYHGIKTEVSSKREIKKLKYNANIIITDMSEGQLKAHGLDISTLQGYKSDIVMVRLVGNMTDTEADFTALCSAYMNYGVGNVLSGEPALTMPRFPEHVIENISSAFLLSACTGGLLHQARHSTSQTITVSYARIGLWLGQLGAISTLRTKDSYKMVAYDRSITKKNYPVFGFLSHKTKDGAYVQLLGLDTKRHLPNILTSLGCKWKTAAKSFFTYLFKVDHKDPVLLRKLDPLFITINESIAESFSNFTYKEIIQRFDSNGTWYGPMRMPSQLISYEQQWDNEVFSKGEASEDHVLVNTPVRIFNF